MDKLFLSRKSKGMVTMDKDCAKVDVDGYSNDGQERIYTRFPLQPMCITGLSSRDFSLMPNGYPWLVFGNRHENCMAYCFLRKTWDNISLSSLLQDSPGKGLWRFYYGSGTGPRLLKKGTLRVYNLLMKTSFELPPMKFMPRSMPKAVVAGTVCGSKESYEVVSVGCDVNSNSNNIQVYDSTENSWRTVFQLPINVKISRHHGLVLCKDVLVCATRLPKVCFLVYNIQEGNSSMSLVPLPVAIRKCKWHLIACGSSVVLVGAVLASSSANQWYLKDGIVWVLEKEEGSSCNWNWKEITRMPPSLCQDPKWRSPYFYECECIGIENYLCLRKKGSRDVCTYNLIDGSWNWLAECPLNKWIPRMIALEPRPNTQI